MKNLNAIGENIRKLRKIYHYTQKDLAELLGVKPTTVASWEQGRNKPLMDKVTKLSNLFGISPTELIGKSNSNLSNNSQPTNMKPIEQSGMHVVRIPIIGTIACGTPILAEQNIDGYTTEFFDEKPDGTLFALKCQGDSMEPKIPNGATVIVRLQPTVENDEIAAVLVDDNEEATLKRIKHVGNQVMLMPENKKYDPILLNEENPGRILGKVIKVSYSL
ncbi:LexA family transcriptional regulator [uncultured Lactobacillus sp.]|uniref:LexA family protein n=1 Tax=uncultured Lactobacillus sp. TaxID=153152 RepID=UPI002638CDD0|nr:XRE family transcriptional regulator [uncultured Lactobacillus sp.]